MKDTVRDTNGSRTSGLDPFEKLLCDELLTRMPGQRLCDLGCGLPYDRYFAQHGCSILGIDASKKHICQAKENVIGEFRVGDFFDVEGKFDAIVSFAMVHVPRTDHSILLVQMHSLLEPDGLMLITLGTESIECLSEDFAGSPMTYSSYSVEYNKKLVQDAGFDIIMACEDYRTQSNLWILARRFI
ncbi:MAG: SAM-dependent methyltransferase [Nanobdellota archaeon]